ncbi:MAG TPA: ribonuclease III [Opitutaceae bacterium]|jgi:ribonuclease-3
MAIGDAARERVQELLSYQFRDPAHLHQALTHPSFRQDHPDDAESNQRMEFLGDAVLQLVLTERLFALYPGEREGVLSKRRSALSRGDYLVSLARQIGVDAGLRLGASEESTGGRDKASVLEDAFEAVVAAVYLDGGYVAARDCLLRIYGDVAARVEAVEPDDNPKGRLQELVQPKHGNRALQYEVVKTEGADHARFYEVQVFLLGQLIGQGRGTSKKQAEESAARSALAGLESK